MLKRKLAKKSQRSRMDDFRSAYCYIYRPYSWFLLEYKHQKIVPFKKNFPVILFLLVISNLFFLVLANLIRDCTNISPFLNLWLIAWFTTSVGISFGLSLSKFNFIENVGVFCFFILALSLITISWLLFFDNLSAPVQYLSFIFGNNFLGIFIGLLSYKSYFHKTSNILNLENDVSQIFKAFGLKLGEINLVRIFNQIRIWKAEKSQAEEQSKSSLSEFAETFYSAVFESSERSIWLRSITFLIGSIILIIWFLFDILAWIFSWVMTIGLFLLSLLLNLLEKSLPSLIMLLWTYIKCFPYQFAVIFFFTLPFLFSIVIANNSSNLFDDFKIISFAIGFTSLAATLPPMWFVEAIILLSDFLRLVFTQIILRKTSSGDFHSPGRIFEYTGTYGFPFLNLYLHLNITLLPSRLKFDKLIYIAQNPACIKATIHPLIDLMSFEPNQKAFSFHKLSPIELSYLASVCYDIELLEPNSKFFSRMLSSDMINKTALTIDKLVFVIKRDNKIQDQVIETLDLALKHAIETPLETPTEKKIIEQSLPFILYLGAQHPDRKVFDSALHLSILYDYEKSLNRIGMALANDELCLKGFYMFDLWVNSDLLRSSLDSLNTLMMQIDYFIEHFQVSKNYDKADEYFRKTFYILIPTFPETTFEKIIKYTLTDRWRRLCVEIFENWLSYLIHNYSNKLLDKLYDLDQRYLEVISSLDEASPGSLFVRRLIDLRAVHSNEQLLDDILFYSERVPSRARLLCDPLVRWIDHLPDENALHLYKSFFEEAGSFRSLINIQVIEEGQDDHPCLKLLYQKAVRQDPIYGFLSVLDLAREKTFQNISAILLLEWTERAPIENYEEVLALLVENSNQILILNELDELIYNDDNLYKTTSSRYRTTISSLIISRLLLTIALNYDWIKSVEFAGKLANTGSIISVRQYFMNIIEQLESEAFDIIRQILSNRNNFSPIFNEIKADKRLLIPSYPDRIWDVYLFLSMMLLDQDIQKIKLSLSDVINILSHHATNSSGYETIAFMDLCSSLIDSPHLDSFDSHKISSELLLWPCVASIVEACNQLISGEQLIPIDCEIVWQSALASLSYQIAQVDTVYIFPESGLLKMAIMNLITSWQKQLDELKIFAEFRVDARPDFRISEEVVYIDITLVIRNIGLHNAYGVKISVEGNEYVNVLQYEQGIIDQIESGKTLERTVYTVALKPGFKTINITLSYQDGNPFIQNKKYPVEVTRLFTKIPNPYVPGPAVENPEVFVGRQSEIERLTDGVLDFQQKRNFLVIGPSRMGKSSLLRQFIRKAQNSYLPINIDFQGNPFEQPDLANLFWYIADEIYKGVKELFPFVPQPTIKALKLAPSMELKKYVNDTLVPIIEKRLPVVLVIDEFNWLTKNVTEKKLPPEIFYFLRHLLEDSKWPRMILAGNINPVEIALPEAREILKSCIKIHIGELSFEQTSELIRSPLRNIVDVDEAAVQMIYDNTDGHPFLVQKICHFVVNWINDKKRSYITTDDIKETLSQILHAEEDTFLSISGPGNLSNNAYVLLKRLSKSIAPGQFFEINHVYNLASESYSQETTSYLIKELERRLFLERSRVNNECYRIKIPLLHIWLKDFAID